MDGNFSINSKNNLGTFDSIQKIATGLWSDHKLSLFQKLLQDDSNRLKETTKH